MNQANAITAFGAAGAGPDASVDGSLRQPSVLVVEDDVDVRNAMSDTLRDAGFAVAEAANAADAIRLLEQPHDFRVMVTDVHMPGRINGYLLTRKVRERWPYVEILMVSGQAAPARRDLDVDCDFLFKPFGSTELIGRVGALARRTE